MMAYNIFDNRWHGKIAYLLQGFGVAQGQLSVIERFLTTRSPTARPA